MDLIMLVDSKFTNIYLSLKDLIIIEALIIENINLLNKYVKYG